jgi:hypothetical protein
MNTQDFANYAANGFLLLVPVLVWNVIFRSKLPHEFASGEFGHDMPAFIPLRLEFSGQEVAWLVYLGGLSVYFGSWLPLVFRPRSLWSRSAAGFLAPGYTPLGLFTGIALLGHSYYFPVRYSPWHYLLPVFGFLGFHLQHVWIVYRRNYPAAD